jgi:F-type H+-transporting ATPase subunit delta
VAAIASRYSRAMVDVVLADKLDAASITAQLQAFAAAVQDSNDLRRVWDSPAISAEQKRAVLDALARQLGAAKAVRNFMAVLIDHHRVPMLGQMVRQFQVELDKQLGVAEAEITSAHALSDEEKRAVESQVAALTNKKVRARYEENPSLLGGIMVRVGSTIYDGSVRGQLARLKEQLSAG